MKAHSPMKAGSPMKQPSSPRSPILNNMNYVNDEIRDILPTPTQINIGTAQVAHLHAADSFEMCLGLATGSSAAIEEFAC